MRGILIGLALLGLASPASAGFYNTIEPLPIIPAERIPDIVRQLRAVANPPKGRMDQGSLRAGYLGQAAMLEQAEKDGILSTIGRVNLGACYLRLGRPRDALRVLNEGDKSHFLIQVNLAAAYDLNGDLEVALRHQQIALSLWPPVWATWKPGEARDFREYERYYLRLLESRIAERRGGRLPEVLDVDPLFPRLRFIGPTGAYEAGALARSVEDQLPRNAVNIVLQLVIWKPQDFRLYWLLAELLNANGFVVEASRMVQELVDAGNHFKDLHEHRKVLKRAENIDRQLRLPRNRYLLFSYFMAIPRTNLGSPGIGTIADGAGMAAPVLLAQMVEKPPIGPAGDFGSVQVPPPPPQMPFNWRHVTVGFAFGFLVAALLGFQWQEWRRRRSLAASEAEEAASAPVRPGDG
jgi:hypothetical protein